jgi:hypothetical protein
MPVTPIGGRARFQNRAAKTINNRWLVVLY